MCCVLGIFLISRFYTAMYCVRLLCVVVLLVFIVSEVLGQTTMHGDVDLADADTVQSFMKTKEFRVREI